MAGYRQPYGLIEDRAILRYIIDGNYGRIIKGNRVWQQMSGDNMNIHHRTWMSLKNRFLKTIIKDLGRPEYKLTVDERQTLTSQFNSIHSSTRQSHHTFLKSYKGKTNENRDPVDETNVVDDDDVPTVSKEKPQKLLTNSVSVVPTTSKEKSEKLFYSLDMDWSDSDSDDSS